MPATPNITLTATLEDLEGAAAGSVANPASLLIALCGFGMKLPTITGTSMLAKIGPFAVRSSGGVISIPLWGNDQISPANTYYTVTVLDGDGNVVQCAAYRFTGSGTIDLSNAMPFVPGQISAIGVYVVPITNCSQVVFDGVLGTGQSLTLTKDVTLSTAQNFTPGQVVPFFIKQDATGGRAFAWPANFIGPPAINLNPNGVTTSMWYLGTDGNYHLYREAILIDPVAPSSTLVQALALIAPAGIDLGGIDALQVTAASCILDALRGRTQSLMLTENTTIAGANNFLTGNLIQLTILQDATGAWVLTWGAEFQSPPPINEAAFGNTTVLWAQDEFGNYYQFGSALWS